MPKTHQIHFRAERIDGESLDDLADLAACDSRAEYLRKLIRDDADARGYDL